MNFDLSVPRFAKILYFLPFLSSESFVHPDRWERLNWIIKKKYNFGFKNLLLIFTYPANPVFDISIS